MMKKFKKIVLTLLLMFIVTINVDALTVKESSKDYTGDVYVFGSTKFDENTIVTLSAAGLAGMNEAKLQLAINGEIDTSKVKTYYYSELTQNWSEVTVETGKLRLLSDAESANLEENLNIYYVNNKEKTFEIPFNGTVDEGSLKPNSIDATSKAEVKDGKLMIPASWIGGFTFTSNNTLVSVDLSKTVKEDVKELDKPLIKINPAVSLTTNDEVYVGENLTVKLAITANDYKGSKATAKLIALDGGNSLTANYNKDVVISDSVESAKLTFSASGVFTIKYTLTFENGNTSEVTRTINVLDADVVAKAGGKYYKNIADVLKVEDNVTLLKDVTVDGLQALFVKTLDLNGKTLILNGNSELGVVNGSDVTITNGNIVTGGYGIQVQDTSKLTVKNDVNMTVNDGKLSGMYGIALYDKATLNFEGNLTVQGDAYGISGNGTEVDTTTINVTGGKISVPNGYAIYQPQKSNTTISGGELTGDGAIGIKSGNLNITGGILTATGKKVTPIESSNGIKKTGSVIYIEENPAYKDNIKINITGGTLTSTSGYIIQEFNPTIGTENELSLTMSGLYTTKNYGETKNSFYYTDEETAFTIDGVKYAEGSLESALKDSKEIKLLKDITLKNTIILTSGNPVVDLNGKTLSMKSTVSTSMFIVKNVSNDLSLTLKNGKIVAQSDEYIYVVKSGYSDFDNKTSGNKKVVTTLDGVKITTNDCGVFVQGSNSVLNVINSEINAGYQAILANGSKGYGTVGSEINVINSVLTGKDLAIFHPQNGTLNIKGSTLTGPTAIGFKSGILNIENSSINATAKEYTQGKPTGDGINLTGDAILVEVRKGYQDVNDTTSKIEVSIAKDVTFTTGTSNTYALRVLNPYTDLTPKLGVKITGLTLNNEASVENEYVFTK